MKHDQLTYRIAFSMIKGLNRSTATGLLARVGDEETFFSVPESSLSAITGIKNGVTETEYRHTLLSRAVTERDFTYNNRIDCRFFNDTCYPRRLLECEDAPVMIYSLGDCDLNSAHVIGVVGTRHATPYGMDFVSRLIADLSSMTDNLVIVSGLAYGIDVSAHKAAINNHIPTVGVLAHGLNTIYPADHRSVAARMISEGGMLLTEYPSSSQIHKGNFLARNRIIAGLCDCVVVIESGEKGGAMSTARMAQAYNRDVFAVPGRINDTYSRGCNYLIASQQACLLRNADDLVNIMGWQNTKVDGIQKQLFPDITPERKQIIDFITANPDATINEMCVSLDLPYKILSDRLFQMEMDDIILTLPGGRYGLVVR